MPSWTLNDNHQAQQEFTKREKAWTTGILVLIDQTIYHFTDEKEWKSQQQELLKDNPGHYALTNLAPWHEWLRERDKNKL